MKHGFIAPERKPEDFLFGAGKLGDAPINPGGDWSSWLPVPENQQINGVEPYDCCTEAFLNVIETLIRHEYGEGRNYSDRWLAWASGTKQRMGNDPATVCDVARKKGCVLETDWPLDPNIRTFDDFYATPPAKLSTLALDLPAEFVIGREFVAGDPASMMAALEYSPLTAGVYAWTMRDDGIYIRPPGAVSEHDVEIFDYKQNYYWLVFDSYEQNIKKLAWDFGFDAVMRYTLHRQIAPTPQAETAWERFKALIRQILGL